MTQYFEVHPQTPQKRLLRQVSDTLNQGGVIVYPTDSGYALGCGLGEKEAAERIRRIRELTDKHHFTLMFRDLSELGQYAKVHNSAFRLLKAHTPGPYTFILQASKEVPRRLLQPKRKTIGLRVPDSPIAKGILDEQNQPIMSVTLILDGENDPMTDPKEIYEQLKGRVDVVVDGGPGDLQPTTIVDLTGDEPELIRQGKGDSAAFT